MEAKSPTTERIPCIMCGHLRVAAKAPELVAMSMICAECYQWADDLREYWQDPLVKFAYTLLVRDVRSQALDCVADTLDRCIEGIIDKEWDQTTENAPADFKPLLFHILKGKCRNANKRRRPPIEASRDASPAIEAIAAASGEPLIMDDRLRVVMDAVARLPEKSRLALTLLISGHNQREIAEALRTSKNAVKVRIHRSVKTIKQELGLA